MLPPEQVVPALSLPIRIRVGMMTILSIFAASSPVIQTAEPGSAMPETSKTMTVDAGVTGSLKVLVTVGVTSVADEEYRLKAVPAIRIPLALFLYSAWLLTSIRSEYIILTWDSTVALRFIFPKLSTPTAYRTIMM